MKLQSFDTKPIVLHVFENAKTTLALQPKDFVDVQPAQSYMLGNSYSYTYSKTLTAHQEEFIKLVDDSLREGFFSSLIPFIEHSHSSLLSADQWSAGHWQKTVHFLSRMTDRLQSDKSTRTEEVQALYKILLAQARRDVRIPPFPVNQGWTMDPMGCKRCDDCLSLDRFLRSPTETVWRL